MTGPSQTRLRFSSPSKICSAPGCVSPRCFTSHRNSTIFVLSHVRAGASRAPAPFLPSIPTQKVDVSLSPALSPCKFSNPRIRTLRTIAPICETDIQAHGLTCRTTAQEAAEVRIT
ncbi:hypothetical protein HGRIS_001376 [Hohenbuehelia grisea]|uniref:Uncharacterized protein n=1 Tax=Hohenbuehelia grisea TaxID=104357 RepID=A0ABR3JQ61_9AGAR